MKPKIKTNTNKYFIFLRQAVKLKNRQFCHHLLAFMLFQTSSTFNYWRKKKIFEECGKPNGLWTALTSVVFFSTMLWGGFGNPHSTKYLILCSAEQRNSYWNKMRVSKWWYNFLFWVNCPFNTLIQQNH